MYKPTTSLLGTLQSLAMGTAHRDVQGTDKFVSGKHSLYIDTCFATDTQSYETCIFVDDDSGTVVELYETALLATKGHKKWVKKLKKSPNTKLEDVVEYGF